MRSTGMILRPLGVVALTALVFVGAAGADEPGVLSESVERRVAAIAAIDVDPWALRDEEIPDRRLPPVAFENHAKDVATSTASARASAEEELEAAEAVLEAALDHRGEMETEVEGYSISMWVLGDLGLQELYDSEVERARQGRPVISVTEALIARVQAADAAIAAAEREVDRAATVLAERVAADDLAQREARRAQQIRERFDAMVVARDLEIDRRADELLTEDRPEVELVTITSVTVQVPIGEPVAAPVGEDTVGSEARAGAVLDGASGSEAPPPATEPRTVAIPPIVVNVEIAGQVQALIGAARSDGIELHGGGYRPREDQITLRIAHCGTSGYDIFDRPAGECTPPTARPGTSQHELGLAVDFTENGQILTWDSPGFAWMVANAGRFGLLNLPSEAWHWSTTGS